MTTKKRESMIVNSLDVVFEADDLQHLVDRWIGKVDQIKELAVRLEEDKVVLAGKISVGLTIPFTTEWQARVLEQECAVALTLAGLSVGMVGMGTEMISTHLFKLLAAKLQGVDAVRLDGNEIIVDLVRALALRNITLTAPLKRVEISAAGILLEMGADEA